MMLNRPWSGSWCCGWPACFGDCGSPRCHGNPDCPKFESDHLTGFRQARQVNTCLSEKFVRALFGRADPVSFAATSDFEPATSPAPKVFAKTFLRSIIQHH